MERNNGFAQHQYSKEGVTLHLCLLCS